MITTAEKKDFIDRLATTIERLPEQERLVISLSYYEELTLKEMSEALGLTEGRICQIRSRAVACLREALGTEISAGAADPHHSQPSPLSRIALQAAA